MWRPCLHPRTTTKYNVLNVSTWYRTRHDGLQHVRYYWLPVVGGEEEAQRRGSRSLGWAPACAIADRASCRQVDRDTASKQSRNDIHQLARLRARAMLPTIVGSIYWRVPRNQLTLLSPDGWRTADHALRIPRH